MLFKNYCSAVAEVVVVLAVVGAVSAVVAAVVAKGQHSVAASLELVAWAKDLS